jgi:hypothetical protein
MGVLACDRAGCENCMCDFYSADYGYLCSWCKKDLETEVEEKGTVDIKVFMATPKRTNSIVSTITEVDEIFKSRYT